MESKLTVRLRYCILNGDDILKGTNNLIMLSPLIFYTFFAVFSEPLLDRL